jgi:hypothetical protein
MFTGFSSKFINIINISNITKAIKEFVILRKLELSVCKSRMCDNFCALQVNFIAFLQISQFFYSLYIFKLTRNLLPENRLGLAYEGPKIQNRIHFFYYSLLS